MMDGLKNLVSVHHGRFMEMVEEDTTTSEHRTAGEKTASRNNNQQMNLPEVIGILPIRNVVAYPGTVTPLAVGRETSKALLTDTQPNESIIGLLTQRNPRN